MSINELRKKYPEHFQYMEEDFEIYDAVDFKPDESKMISFKKLNSKRSLSYPFYKSIVRMIKPTESHGDKK